MNHCIIKGDRIICLHCGGWKYVPTFSNLFDYRTLISTFLTEHGSCLPPPPPPPPPATSGITCSNCGGNDHRVLRTRPGRGMICRRLVCRACGYRHTTHETLAPDPSVSPAPGQTCLTCVHHRDSEHRPCSLGHPDPREVGPSAGADCNDWKRDDDAAT